MAKTKAERERESVRIVPIVESHVRDVLMIANEQLQSIRPQDDFGVVGGVFLARLIEHAESILQLGDKRDSDLIARSILEGMVLLKWMSKDEPLRNERAKSYRYLSLVETWRRMESQRDRGREIAPEHWKAILDAIIKSDNGAILAEEYNNLTPPIEKVFRNVTFYERLTGKTWDQLFKEVEGEAIYSSNYAHFSGFLHWNPLQLGVHLASDGGIDYERRSPADYVTCLVATRVCLGETLLYLSSHLKLGLEENIGTLNRHFASDLGMDLLQLPRVNA